MMNRYEIRVSLDKRELVVEARKFPRPLRYSIDDKNIKLYLRGIPQRIQISNIRYPYFTFDGEEITWDALCDKINQL